MEVHLIKDYINLAVGDLKEVVISSTGDMKNSIDEMNQTLKTHNGQKENGNMPRVHPHKTVPRGQAIHKRQKNVGI